MGMQGKRVDDIFLKALFKRALGGNRQGLLPLWFDPAVLEAYRGNPGYQIVRTTSVGRLKREGSFVLDFGIPEGGGVIHTGLEAFTRLPEREVEHWLGFLVTLPLSSTFAQMQMAPGDCYDDGDARPYFD